MSATGQHAPLQAVSFMYPAVQSGPQTSAAAGRAAAAAILHPAAAAAAAGYHIHPSQYGYAPGYKQPPNNWDMMMPPVPPQEMTTEAMFRVSLLDFLFLYMYA